MNVFGRTSLFVAVLACTCNSLAGDITGTVTLKGKPPPERRVDLQSHADLAAKHPKGLTTRHYEVGVNGGLQNVLVYLRGDFAGAKLEPFRTPTLLNYVDGLFQPYVLGVQVGQKLQLKCSTARFAAFTLCRKRIASLRLHHF